MYYFSSLTLPELAPILSIFAAMLAGFYAIAKLMVEMSSKEREADREERKKLASGIERMAKASEKTAEAVEKQAHEAELRNGHLAELSIEGHKAILRAVERINVQNINEQKVHHQTIEKKD